MQISSNRPAMRSGASSVAHHMKPNQAAQQAQTSKSVTMGTNAAQQTRNQQQAQLLGVGGTIDFTA